MLTKVSAALSRFVTPIQTSSPGSSPREKDFVPSAKIIPIRARRQGQEQGQESESEPGEGPAQDPTQDKPQAPGSALGKAELGSAFLQLFASLRQHRASIFNWLGLRRYQAGARSTKKTGRLRKGAMLDVRVD